MGKQSPRSAGPLDRRVERDVQTAARADGIELAARIDVNDFEGSGADRVIAALILNVRRRGDRLAEVLTGLADSAREELELCRRVSAGRAGMHRAVQIVVILTRRHA